MNKSVRRITSCFTILAGLLAAGPRPAPCLSLTGTIRSGTTGRAVIGVAVEALNPHQGMLVEQSVEASNGSFAFEGLSDSSRVYLIRVKYLDVSYTELIVAREEAPEPIAFTVYDTSSAWSAVSVSVPNFYAKREQNHLRIEKIFEITNRTDPPRAITGPGLPVFIPEDHTDINSVFVMEHNIPIHLHPTPTENPSVYRIPYPLKPGVTRLALSFDVPYENGEYTYEETLPVALQLVRLLTDDPHLEISSRTPALQKTEEDHGVVSYQASNLAKSAVLAVDFSGGAASTAIEGNPAGRRVIVRSVAGENGAVPIIVIMVLVGLAVYSMFVPSRAAGGGSSPEELREFLLVKMARLDDLRAAEAVTETAYRAKRAELKEELRQLYASPSEPKHGPSQPGE